MLAGAADKEANVAFSFWLDKVTLLADLQHDLVQPQDLVTISIFSNVALASFMDISETLDVINTRIGLLMQLL